MNLRLVGVSKYVVFTGNRNGGVSGARARARAVLSLSLSRCDAMHAAAVCSLGFGFGAKMVQLIDAGGRFKRVAAPWG